MFFVLLVSGYTVNGQAFWQGTEYGMTVAQVKKLFPDAFTFRGHSNLHTLPPSDQPPPFKDMSNLYGRMDYEVSIPNIPDNLRLIPDDCDFYLLDDVDIVGERFVVRFIFKNGLLDRITLSLRYGWEGKDYGALYRDIFLPISKELSAKYGKNIGSNNEEQEWIFGKTTVRLRLFEEFPEWGVGIFYTYSS